MEIELGRSRVNRTEMVERGDFLISANSFVQRAGIAAISKEGDEGVAGAGKRAAEEYLGYSRQEDQESTGVSGG